MITPAFPPPGGAGLARRPSVPAKPSATAAPPPTTTNSLLTNNKPAFTTHQQHYSPLKSLGPKPLTSTFLAPPSPSKLPANVALSAETARLQTELLQLHLLHRGGRATLAAWEASARERLRARWDAARERERDAAALELAAEEARNAAALLRWCVAGAGGGGGGGGSGGGGLVQKKNKKDGGGGGRLLLLGPDAEARVAALDGVVNGVWAAAERQERLARQFERWARRAAEIFASRSSSSASTSNQTSDPADDNHPPFSPPPFSSLLGSDGALVLVGGLDAAWKAECAALGRRLDEWRRLLRELGEPEAEAEAHDRHHDQRHDTDQPPPPVSGNGSAPSLPPTTTTTKSSLARILAGCRALVDGILAELHVMEAIEREAAAEEMRWVREMNRRGDEDEADAGARRAGAIWRAL